MGREELEEGGGEVVTDTWSRDQGAKAINSE
jgi:hypothetical protein